MCSSLNSSASISQRCLVLAWPSKRICSRERAALRADKQSVWRDSNESRCFVPLLAHKHYIEHLSNSSYRFIEENYIVIIIVIELSPSPRCISAKYCPIITNHTSMESYLFSFQMMHKSQFQKMYTYDWFCAPGSHISVRWLIFLVQKISHGVSFFFIFPCGFVWERMFQSVLFLSVLLIFYGYETFTEASEESGSTANNWWGAFISVSSSVSASAGRVCGVQPSGSAGLLQSGQTEWFLTFSVNFGRHFWFSLSLYLETKVLVTF